MEKLNKLVEDFELGLKAIEKQAQDKIKEADGIIIDNQKLSLMLKTQIKENSVNVDKVRQILADDKSKQEVVLKQINDELNKQSAITKSIKDKEDKIIESLKVAELSKSKELEQEAKRKELIEEAKSKVKEVEKKLDIAIKKETSTNALSEKLTKKEKELNDKETRLEKKETELGDRELTLDVRNKQLDRAAKTLKLKE